MEKYISRCIQLAKNGLGITFPNPMVGCVIVHNDKIIGEGFTSPYGGPHAEVNAINSVRDKSLLTKATLFVTLEPCSHYGKTPPCADLIIEHNIPNVVIGTMDPNSKVAGQGIQRLKDTGCQVVVGVLENQCVEHHKRFLAYHKKNRPYIILKWAETLDGFIAPEKTERTEKIQPYWITNEYSRQLVHKWRSEEQAILVGTNTVLMDNPKLNVRTWKGNSPIRVILDKDLKITNNLHVFDKSVKTIILTQNGNIKKSESGIDYIVIDFSKNLVSQICEVLYQLNIISVLIEGGAQTLRTFITANIWDEARVFRSQTRLDKGLKAPIIKGKIVKIQNIETDTLTVHRND